MSASGNLIFLCFFSALLVELRAEPPKVPNVKDIHKSATVANENMARLIKVDYSFETESVMYDVVENKVKAPSTIVAGNFTFESLHHDLEGGMLGRYRLTVCKTGNCGNVPDVYVSFIQGGNNIQEVLYDPKQFSDQEPRWNFIYAIINTIYTPADNGGGDTQFVDTVYGKCEVQFGRPEDKRFRRKINNCEIKDDMTHKCSIRKSVHFGYLLFLAYHRDWKRNYTRIDGIQPVLYEQDVSYIQNTKVDADIVIIDAIELLRFGTPLHDKWGFTLESRTHVEITNRTMHYVPRHCNAETQTAAVCASEKFGAVSVGQKLYEQVVLGRKDKKNELADLVSKYRSHLFEMGDSHTCEKHSRMFAEIVQEAREATEEDWRAVLMHPENEPVLHVLGNVLGALGNVLSLNITRTVLNVQGPEFLDDYLLGAAHTTSNDGKWHKQLMYWMADVKEEEETYWKVANTIATILRRRCERTPSIRNSCHHGKEKIVAKFIKDISTCSSEKCHHKALEVLRNIPISASVEYARGFLCSAKYSPAVQIAALQLIKAASSKLYDAKLANVLIRLFRNVCPQPTTTSESQLAIDILLRCVPEQQHVATMLLRSESLNPENAEKWQYFYKAVESSAQKDELTDEFWRQMRKFKVFRPNYAHRSLEAGSHAHWQGIAEVDGYKLFSTSEVEFDLGMFKRSEFDINLKHGKVDESLFKLTTMASGLDSLISDRAPFADPEAKVRISFLGHALPTVVLFKGATDLMSAVWNADGHTIKALEGNVMVRDTSVKLPLLSGLTAEVSSSGALSFKVLTSAYVSLFEQQSLAELSTNISMSLSSRASLLHHGEVVHTLRSNVAAITTVGAEADVQFGRDPLGFCVKMQRNNVDFSFESTEETPTEPRKPKTITTSTTHPGVTYRLDDIVTKQCNMLLKSDINPEQ